jgi:hypothetical protein
MRKLFWNVQTKKTGASKRIVQERESTLKQNGKEKNAGDRLQLLTKIVKLIKFQSMCTVEFIGPQNTTTTKKNVLFL